MLVDGECTSLNRCHAIPIVGRVEQLGVHDVRLQRQRVNVPKDLARVELVAVGCRDAVRRWGDLHAVRSKVVKLAWLSTNDHALLVAVAADHQETDLSHQVFLMGLRGIGSLNQVH